MVELDVGTGRRVPGRAHSPVRDGGGAPAVIDRRRECRRTRDRCGWPGELMLRAVAEATLDDGDAALGCEQQSGLPYIIWQTPILHRRNDRKAAA